MACLAVVGCAADLFGTRAAEAEAARAEATRLESRGDFAQAARAWEAVAEASRGTDRERALIDAIEAWLKAGNVTRARDAAGTLPADGDPALARRRAVAEAQVALRSQDPATARVLLAGLDTGPGLTGSAEILALRADAEFALGNAAAGVADLVAREARLPAPDRPANQRRIWNRMQEAAARGASLDTPPGADPVVAGWLELGRLATQSDSPFQLRAAVLGWQQRNPEHPAALGVTQELLAEARALSRYPARLALLLPLSGRLAGPGRAVRDGFAAAYLATDTGQESPPVLDVYDTVALGVTAAYEEAVQNGAEFVVGPLLKSDVAELAGAALPAVPTLALNWADDGVAVPGHVAQFALAPEDEATEAARRAMADGHCFAVALVPDTDQGLRIAESFGAALQEAGCRLLEWQRYFEGDRDFSAEITSLLLIDESESRHERLQGFLRRPLEFEPRRRQDADLIFLGADPEAGRLILPQLQYFFAKNLPVYAGSAIYAPGRADTDDLSGIRFPVMRWRVDPAAPGAAFMNQFSAFGPGALDRYGRLYAFGADAWRLVPLVHNRSGRLAEGVPGLTGTLFLGADGRVHRRLDWARFSDGEAVPLPAAAAPADGIRIIE
ncbi:MAG: penicillin-binding protein activator [Gammaproteobacteria bacterium]